MDLLRSTYVRNMRFVVGDPMITFAAAWYFCKPTAKPFPDHHRFGSGNWDSDKGGIVAIGDIGTSRQLWRAGWPLNMSDGTQYAGPLSAFQNGVDAPSSILRCSEGTPASCMPGRTGLVKGGFSIRGFVMRALLGMRGTSLRVDPGISIATGGKELGGGSLPYQATLKIGNGGKTLSGSSLPYAAAMKINSGAKELSNP